MSLYSKFTWYKSVIFERRFQRSRGRYFFLIAGLYLAEELILLNLLFFCLLPLFNLEYENEYQLVLFLINLSYLLSFALVRSDYNDERQLYVPNLLRLNLFRLSCTALALSAGLFFLKIAEPVSRLFIFTFFCSGYFLITFCQWVTRKLLTITIKNTVSKGVILGAGTIGIKFFDELLSNIYNGVVILGFFDDDRSRNNGDVIGSIEDAKEFVLNNDVTNIFCTLPLAAEEKIIDFIKFAESNVINFHIVPSIGYYYSGDQAIVTQIGKMPVFALRRIPLSYTHNAFIKRVSDIIISSIFLMILFPFLFPVVSILIKRSSPGPILFKQKRTGRNKKEFICYKFRTMCKNEEADMKQATLDDTRITRIGNFLRKTSLDELPQFYNVLKGDMSIVGPRPHMLQHTYEYSPKVDKYMVRHFVKPGITGWAQVKGYRGETKEIGLMEKRIMQDILYVENWSLWLDIKIMIKTAYMIVKGDDKAF